MPEDKRKERVKGMGWEILLIWTLNKIKPRKEGVVMPKFLTKHNCLAAHLAKMKI